MMEFEFNRMAHIYAHDIASGVLLAPIHLQALHCMKQVQLESGNAMPFVDDLFFIARDNGEPVCTEDQAVAVNSILHDLVYFDPEDFDS